MEAKIQNGKFELVDVPASEGALEPACKAAGCGRGVATAGYCARHYQQVRRHGRLTPEREYQPLGVSCKAPNCGGAPAAKGYCFKHYQQVRRHGRLTPERERT